MCAESIKDISWNVAHEMMVWYGNNDTVKYPKGEIGVHGDPYHWVCCFSAASVPAEVY